MEDLNLVLHEKEIMENDPFILIVCNKQDLPGAMSPEAYKRWLLARPGMAETLKSRRWEVLGCSAVANQGIKSIVEVPYQDLVMKKKTKEKGKAIANPSRYAAPWSASSSTTKPLPAAADITSTSALTLSIQIPQHVEMPPISALEDRIRETSDTPADHDAFLETIRLGTTAPFDHRAHLRLAFILLVRSAARNEPQSIAVLQITKCLKEFFKNADPTRIRPTYHETMTLFWSYTVAYETMCYTLSKPDRAIPTEDEFELMLKHAPRLMWGGLWQLYYSKGRLLDGEQGRVARQGFVLPDLNILPSYITIPFDSSISSSSSADDDPESDSDENAWEIIPPTTVETDDEIQNPPSPYDLSDDALSDRVDLNRLLAFLDDRTLIRYIFLTLRRAMMTSQRRGEAVTQIMRTVERVLLRIRGQLLQAGGKIEADGSVSGAEGAIAIKFSETKVYFWSQIVWQRLVAQTTAEGGIGDITFNEFRDQCPECRDTTFWKLFYSEKVWGSVEANMSFVLPDKKPLPNVLKGE